MGEINKEHWENTEKRAAVCMKLLQTTVSSTDSVKEGYECLTITANTLLAHHMKSHKTETLEYVKGYIRTQTEKVIESVLNTIQRDPKDVANFVAEMDRKFKEGGD